MKYRICLLFRSIFGNTTLCIGLFSGFTRFHIQKCSAFNRCILFSLQFGLQRFCFNFIVGAFQLSFGSIFHTWKSPLSLQCLGKQTRWALWTRHSRVIHSNHLPHSKRNIGWVQTVNALRGCIEYIMKAACRLLKEPSNETTQRTSSKNGSQCCGSIHEKTKMMKPEKGKRFYCIVALHAHTLCVLAYLIYGRTWGERVKCCTSVKWPS